MKEGFFHEPLFLLPMYLLLDIDGVLNPFGDVSGYSWEADLHCSYSDCNASWLRTIGQRIQLVWASAWEHMANDVVAPLHGLDPLPYISFERAESASFLDWKLPSILEWVEDKPFIWIDDDMSLVAKEMADERNQKVPTLFLQPSCMYGLEQQHKDRIEAWIQETRNLGFNK